MVMEKIQKKETKGNFGDGIFQDVIWNIHVWYAFNVLSDGKPAALCFPLLFLSKRHLLKTLFMQL